VKLKEFIRKLKDFDEDLLVTFGDDYSMGGMAYTKEHSDLFRGSLEVVETPIGSYVRMVKAPKGQYLLIDLSNADIFTPDDFKK
jgi:hypothetical protein